MGNSCSSLFSKVFIYPFLSEYPPSMRVMKKSDINNTGRWLSSPIQESSCSAFVLLNQQYNKGTFLNIHNSMLQLANNICNFVIYIFLNIIKTSIIHIMDSMINRYRMNHTVLKIWTRNTDTLNISIISDYYSGKFRTPHCDVWCV